MGPPPPATFDDACATLRCPRCGNRARGPCAIRLQTHLAREPAMAELHVGDPLQPTEDPEEAGYYRLSENPDPTRLRVIETWTCPNCGESFLWALLSVERNILTAVDPIELDEATLAGADYITGQLAYLTPVGQDVKLNDLGGDELRAEIVRLERSRNVSRRY